MKTELSKIAQDLEKNAITENEARALLLGLLGVSGSASSEPNPADQPRMWVNWYQIIYGSSEKEAKKAWRKKMDMLGY